MAIMQIEKLSAHKVVGFVFTFAEWQPPKASAVQVWWFKNIYEKEATFLFSKAVLSTSLSKQGSL